MSTSPWIFVAFCAVIGCVSAPKPVAVKPSHPAIRYGGFFDVRDPDAPRFAWPGTHIEARFSGTSLRAKLTSKPVDDETRDTDWITVVIDGGEPKVFALAEGEHVYPLASGLPQGSHRVLIWKRTEPEVGTITFHGFKLDDGASIGPRVPVRPRRMFFVGDSITAGYGIDGPNQSCTWNVAYENNYATYGAVAARLLNAEYVAAAWSGKGISRNYEERDVETMLQLYRRIIPTEPDSPEAHGAPADVVVVNLGTNDFGRGAPDKASVLGAFERLLGELRDDHPKALVVLVLGPMLFDDGGGVQQRTLMRAWLKEVRARRVAQGDHAVELLEVWTDPAEGLGCESHPNRTTHARLAAELAALVKRRLGW
jgi:lysophospholipase L1-like esterase